MVLGRTRDHFLELHQYYIFSESLCFRNLKNAVFAVSKGLPKVLTLAGSWLFSRTLAIYIFRVPMAPVFKNTTGWPIIPVPKFFAHILCTLRAIQDFVHSFTMPIYQKYSMQILFKLAASFFKYGPSKWPDRTFKSTNNFRQMITPFDLKNLRHWTQTAMTCNVNLCLQNASYERIRRTESGDNEGF